MVKMDLIDIIIITQNNIQKLSKCIESLSQHLDNQRFKYNIVIVDNFSTSSNRQRFNKEIYKKYDQLLIKPILLAKKLTFLKSLNIGLNYCFTKKHKGKYIWLLHDDTQILRGSVGNLIDILNSSEDIACVNSITTNQIDSNTYSTFRQAFNLSKQELNILYKNGLNIFLNQFPDLCKEGVSYPINNLSIFSTIFQRDYLENEIKYLDQDLVSQYGYDILLKDKILNSSKKKMLLVPGSIVYHEGNQILENESSFATNQNIKLKYQILNTQKKIIYTVACYDWEILPEIKNTSNDCQYICFKNYDVKLQQNSKWKLIDIIEFQSVLNLNTKENSQDRRILKDYFKTHPHHFFKNSTNVQYIDLHLTNYQINVDTSKNFFYAKKNNIPDVYTLLQNYKNTNQIDQNQYNAIKYIFEWYKFPQENNLVSNHYLITNPQNQKCKQILDQIWNYSKFCSYYSNIQFFINLLFYIKKQNILLII